MAVSTVDLSTARVALSSGTFGVEQATMSAVSIAAALLHYSSVAGDRPAIANELSHITAQIVSMLLAADTAPSVTVLGQVCALPAPLDPQPFASLLAATTVSASLTTSATLASLSGMVNLHYAVARTVRSLPSNASADDARSVGSVLAALDGCTSAALLRLFAAGKLPVNAVPAVPSNLLRAGILSELQQPAPPEASPAAAAQRTTVALCCLLAMHDSGTARQTQPATADFAASAFNFVWTVIPKLLSLPDVLAVLAGPLPEGVPVLAGETTMASALLVRAVAQLLAACDGLLPFVTSSDDGAWAQFDVRRQSQAVSGLLCASLQALDGTCSPGAQPPHGPSTDSHGLQLSSAYTGTDLLSGLLRPEEVLASLQATAAGPDGAQAVQCPSSAPVVPPQLNRKLKAPKFWAARIEGLLKALPHVLGEDMIACTAVAQAAAVACGFCTGPCSVPSMSVEAHVSGAIPERQGARDGRVLVKVSPRAALSEPHAGLPPAALSFVSILAGSRTGVEALAGITLQSGFQGLGGLGLDSPVSTLVEAMGRLQMLKMVLDVALSGSRPHLDASAVPVLLRALVTNVMPACAPILDAHVAITAAAQRHADGLCRSVCGTMADQGVTTEGFVETGPSAALLPWLGSLRGLADTVAKILTSQDSTSTPVYAAIVSGAFVSDCAYVHQFACEVPARVEATCGGEAGSADSMGSGVAQPAGLAGASFATMIAQALTEVLLRAGGHDHVDRAADALVRVLSCPLCPPSTVARVFASIMPQIQEDKDASPAGSRASSSDGAAGSGPAQADAAEALGLSPSALGLFSSDAFLRPVRALLKACYNASRDMHGNTQAATTGTDNSSTYPPNMLGVLAAKASAPSHPQLRFLVFPWLNCACRAAIAVAQSVAKVSGVSRPAIRPGTGSSDDGANANVNTMGNQGTESANVDVASLRLYGPLYAEALGFIGDAVTAGFVQASTMGAVGSVVTSGSTGPATSTPGTTANLSCGLDVTMWRSEGPISQMLLEFYKLLNPVLKDKGNTESNRPGSSSGPAPGSSTTDGPAEDTARKAAGALIDSGSLVSSILGFAKIVTVLCGEPGTFHNAALLFPCVAMANALATWPQLTATGTMWGTGASGVAASPFSMAANAVEPSVADRALVDCASIMTDYTVSVLTSIPVVLARKPVDRVQEILRGRAKTVISSTAQLVLAIAGTSKTGDGGRPDPAATALITHTMSRLVTAAGTAYPAAMLGLRPETDAEGRTIGPLALLSVVPPPRGPAGSAPAVAGASGPGWGLESALVWLDVLVRCYPTLCDSMHAMLVQSDLTSQGFDTDERSSKPSLVSSLFDCLAAEVRSALAAGLASTQAVSDGADQSGASSGAGRDSARPVISSLWHVNVEQCLAALAQAMGIPCPGPATGTVTPPRHPQAAAREAQ